MSLSGPRKVRHASTGGRAGCPWHDKSAPRHGKAHLGMRMFSFRTFCCRFGGVSSQLAAFSRPRPPTQPNCGWAAIFFDMKGAKNGENLENEPNAAFYSQIVDFSLNPGSAGGPEVCSLEREREGCFLRGSASSWRFEA